MRYAVHVEFDTGDDPFCFPVRTYLFATETEAREFACHAGHAKDTTNVSVCEVVPVQEGIELAKSDLAAWIWEQRSTDEDDE